MEMYEVLEQDDWGNTVRFSKFASLSEFLRWWGKEGPYYENVTVWGYVEGDIRTVFKRVRNKILANSMELCDCVVREPVEEGRN